jgi:leukocyte elastase inhibitor
MTIMGWSARALAAALALIFGLKAGPAMAQLNIAAEARVTLLARAYNSAGQQLFGQLAAAPGNVAFSPYSVGTALSMLITGARGDTATEMMRALSVRMAADALDAANAEMLSILNGYDQSNRPPVCPPPATASGGNCESRPGGEGMSQCPPGLRLVGNRCIGPSATAGSAKVLAANALMLQQYGDLISADYMAALKTKYAAEIFRNASLDDINGWVARKTEGKIPRMLDAVDPGAAATLLNAVYFKARWASVFDPSFTKSEPFDLSKSQKADVPFMHQTGRFTLVSRGGYKAVRLNYEVPELGLVIVLPDDIDGTGAVARRLGTNELAELFAALHDNQARKPVMLALPRFKLTYRADLKAPLQQAGIRKAFDADAADFSGMTGRPAGEGRVHIGDIVHRAVIEAAEESTEAAAATAAGVRSAAMPSPAPAPFRADHPFLFYLVDDTTGAILFQGRVADPRG